MDKDRIDRASQLEVPLFPLLKENIHSNYLCESGASLTSVKENPRLHVTGWVSGRITQINNLGKICFLFVKRDDKLWQICVTKDQEVPFQAAKKMQVGDILTSTGYSFRTEKGKLCLWVTEVQLLTKSYKDPGKVLSDNKTTDTEKLYRQPYLAMMQGNLNVIKQRSRITNYLRTFFELHDFIEVETPTLLSVNSGANAKPFTTQYNALGEDFFLRVAPELSLKKLLVGGMERIFEIGKNYRNEGMSKRHNPEFTSLEAYSAYTDCSSMIQTLIALVEKLCESLHLEWMPIFQVVTMKKLVEEYVPHKVPYEQLNSAFEDYVAPILQSPTIVTDYPIYCSPLAKAKDEYFADRFEFYWNGMEIANGFAEENDPIEQRKKFLSQAAKKDEEMGIDEDFLTALEYGMPPSTGLGIGIDRLVMCLLGLDNINDVITFPTYSRK